MADYADYSWLVEGGGQQWLARLASDPRRELQHLAALRRDLSPERARLLVDQIALRRQAAAKFGAQAERMYFTRTLLEQATDSDIAHYKAARFAALGGDVRLVGDYCCGIGGDLIELAQVAPVVGWDRSPTARLMAEANLRAVVPEAVGRTARVGEADVEELTPAAGDAWHLDPDRRAAGQRTARVELYSPGPALVDRWSADNPDGAVKLAPAADPPQAWRTHGELEWISSRGECRQLVVWFGRLARQPGQRRATKILSTGVQATCIGAAHLPCNVAEMPGQFLFDPDPAVLAAGLLGQLASQYGLCTLGAGGAYLSGTAPLDEPLLAPFEVLDCVPLRVGDVARRLSARQVGQLEIKKRGVAIDPEALRRRLKLRGQAAATLILTRVGRRELAVIAQRAPTPGLNEALPSG